jgi:hypothetical protein
MININNPTPQQLAQITTVQNRRLADLQQLPHWSNSQFEEVICCLTFWSDEHQQWVHDVEAICELTFDVRVPYKFAAKLSQILNYWRDSGQLKPVATTR